MSMVARFVKRHIVDDVPAGCSDLFDHDEGQPAYLLLVGMTSLVLWIALIAWIVKIVG